MVRLRLVNEEKSAYDGVIKQREREIADEERKFKEAEFERMKQGDESNSLTTPNFYIPPSPSPPLHPLTAPVSLTLPLPSPSLS